MSTFDSRRAAATRHESPVTSLAAAIYALLPLIHAVIDEHRSSGPDGPSVCARCQVPQPCRLLDFAVDAMDLV